MLIIVHYYGLREFFVAASWWKGRSSYFDYNYLPQKKRRCEQANRQVNAPRKNIILVRLVPVITAGSSPEFQSKPNNFDEI